MRDGAQFFVNFPTNYLRKSQVKVESKVVLMYRTS